MGGRHRRRSRSPRANFAWAAGGSIAFQVCQWLVLVTLARSVSEVAVGQFAFALAVTLPPLLLASLNTRIALATDVTSRFLFLDYLALRLGALVIATGGITVVALLVCGTHSAALLIVLVAVARCFDWTSDIIYGLLQKHEMMNRIGVSRILQGVLQLAAISLAAAVFGDLLAVAAAWAATSAVVTLSYDLWSVVLVARRYPAEIARSGLEGCADRVRRLFRISLPLAGARSVGGLIGNVPIYALQHWRSASEVGTLAVELRLVLAAGLCFGALADVATPRLAHHYAQHYAAFRRLAGRLLLVGAGNGLLITLGTALAGGSLLRLFYGPNFADVRLAMLLAVSTSLNLLSLALAAVAAAAHRYSVVFRAALTQLAITTVVALATTPQLGLTGAGLALLSGQACNAGLMAVAVRRLTKRAYHTDSSTPILPMVPTPRDPQEADTVREPLGR